MLILVQRRRQIKVVLLVLCIEGLWRQQRHLNTLQQLKHPFNLERGRATGEFTFLAALLDRDTVDGVCLHKRPHLSGEGFDVRGVFIVVEGDFFGADGDVLKAGLALTGQGEDGFAAFNVDTANSHKSPIRH